MVGMEARRKATSKARETREPSAEGYYDVMDVVEDALDVEDDDNVVDITDSTAVFQEIKVYLDAEKDLETSLVYVNDDREEVKAIMTSVEARPDPHIYLDVDRGVENGMVYVNDEGEEMRTVLRSVEAKSEL